LIRRFRRETRRPRPPINRVPGRSGPARGIFLRVETPVGRVRRRALRVGGRRRRPWGWPGRLLEAPRWRNEAVPGGAVGGFPRSNRGGGGGGEREKAGRKILTICFSKVARRSSTRQRRRRGTEVTPHQPSSSAEGGGRQGDGRVSEEIRKDRSRRLLQRLTSWGPGSVRDILTDVDRSPLLTVIFSSEGWAGDRRGFSREGRGGFVDV